jgi:hypothetical protein
MLTLEVTVCPATSTMRNSSITRALQQSPLNGCATPNSECASDTALTPPTTLCRQKSPPKGPLEECLIPRAARKRPYSCTEPEDDNILPSRKDKSPRIVYCPDIARWQDDLPSRVESNIHSTHSQQDHSTSLLHASLPDHRLTRSISHSTVPSDGSSRPELGNLSRPLDLLSDQAKTELMASLFTSLLYTGSMPSECQKKVYPYAKAMVQLTSNLNERH